MVFRQTRYQTGEIGEIVAEMRNGGIPCMDVVDNEEMEWFIDLLQKYGIYRVECLPNDKNARDRIKEPEFEFRIPFSSSPVKAEEIDSAALMYIDVYFEPDIERTYDSVGEM